MTITPATHAISINPATGEQLSVLPWAGADDIENALQLAAAGFRDWRETNIDYRAEKLRDIGKALRARSEEMAQNDHPRNGQTNQRRRALKWRNRRICVTGMQNMAGNAEGGTYAGGKSAGGY